ncbi:isoleucine--tRNA ligase [Pedobacter heparinus]|uniref:Isoleucine--tRNA ligase n=1 Tax=Pedobacter heparinus (strain ATCC 13125 / DSM 2366 / CIP 104194 / JCM 7457 / NBRC 12017 / NCIMB 9290 / NRRL B-14731 / HIM 762-3) TaxID=485917 RepID=C6XZU9_PEDHD|nr:isoleucine--tRNA ligase [Pedobacter heparinus]ACU02644.1 isoleucyl-tRNA synthetase [Pedobacter heparinus DSM 2366]
MYREFKQLELAKIGKEILDFWKAENIFEKSISTRSKSNPFTFYEGPPSANGMPGIHHVMARAIKDIFCRYKTQKGFQVKRKAGWDTHGLPVELGTEKELGITKEDIGKTISIEAYNEACKKTVMRYTDVWNDLTEKMGYWVDMSDPYVTYKSKYMESVWWLLKQIYDKGLLYKGYTIQPYSPKAGTGLSSHEVNQPGAYRDVTDTTIVAQFKALPETLPVFLRGFGDIHLMAWTTTPWTLPSNTALTVGPKIDYVLVKTFNQYTFLPVNVIIAKGLVAKQFGKLYFESQAAEDFDNFATGDKKIPYQILAGFKGKDLVGIKYEQLLPYTLPYQNPENAFRVISGDFVTTEDGTGIVHTAPTFGADDAKVAKEAVPEVPPMLVLDENGIPVPLVDLQGKFTAHVGELAGKYVKNEYYEAGMAPEKSVDVEIAIRLKEENKAFKVEKYVHSYPHSWRTDEPLLYYPLDSWFIKVTDVKDRMFELNETINWKPKSTGEGRFGNWLKNANDWNLSRSRYWGIPLPIWRTEDKKEEVIIGSVEELYQAMELSVASGFMKENPFKGFEIGNMTEENYELVDLHKNVVDEIVLVSASGKPMKRESDLIDVWFDSGAMPYAQWHYPFENKDKVDSGTDFPADFIAEGVDQTRGWFYTLHAIGALVFDKVAYKNVVSNGLVLDKNGQKMSKRLGNAADPFKTLEEYGPDATRWYMISNANPWDNLKFDIEGIAEIRRKFFGTLYNTYAFFALYANIDKFEIDQDNLTPVAERSELDRWILSLLQTLIAEVDESYNSYEPTKATRAIQAFVDEHLSNWYIRLSRRRFWKGEMTADKKAAYETLYTCLISVAQMMAPVAPFFADWLYRNLSATENNAAESIHLALWKEADATLIDTELNERMQLAQDISSMVLSLRKKTGINVRQPLAKILIPVLDNKFAARVELVKELILSETNIKGIEYITDTAGFIKKKIKPNFKALGPKVGKDMKMVAERVSNMNQEELANFENTGKYLVSGTDYVIELGDVEIIAEDIPGWQVTNMGSLTVALDVSITEALKQEGLSRELINRIQNLRKELGYEVTDRITVTLQNHNLVNEAVAQNKTYICAEILADNINLTETLDNGNKIVIDEVELQILIAQQ